MRKTHVLFASAAIISVILALLLTLSTPTTTRAILSIQPESQKKIVDKEQGEAFTVDVTLKNTGDADDKWDVNVSFESESNWSWKGTPQTLTLKRSKTATLTWTGNVPNNAATGSMARLVVYFNDEFAPQDWWILVTSKAKLEIINSEVS